MRLVAAVALVGMWAGTIETMKSPSGEIAKRDARRAKAAQAELENDTRLANLTDAPPQKLGILTYYPNKGGGNTFIQGKDIVFYALPYTPSTYKCEVRVWQRVTLGARGGFNPHGGGATAMANVTQSINVPTIGPSKVPFGGQTIYRTEMSNNGKDGFYREDIRLAYWSRETSDGEFKLWILADDNETRMKVKSIVPVLETAPKPIPLSVP
jgi:hypothetical protein